MIKLVLLSSKTFYLLFGFKKNVDTNSSMMREPEGLTHGLWAKEATMGWMVGFPPKFRHWNPNPHVIVFGDGAWGRELGCEDGHFVMGLVPL